MRNTLIIIILLLLLGLLALYLWGSSRHIGESVTPLTDDTTTSNEQTISTQDIKQAGQLALEHVAQMEGLADPSDPQIISSRHGLQDCPDCHEFIVRTGVGDMATEIIVEVDGDMVSGWVTK